MYDMKIRDAKTSSIATQLYLHFSDIEVQVHNSLGLYLCFNDPKAKELVMSSLPINLPSDENSMRIARISDDRSELKQ